MIVSRRNDLDENNGPYELLEDISSFPANIIAFENLPQETNTADAYESFRDALDLSKDLILPITDLFISEQFEHLYSPDAESPTSTTRMRDGD
ncbi:8807_t:CDS:2 [Paraglomus occultum]|uniref:8807_t:CDS:1 n=1 Tax=Paraglomus occultum TaxID=144539 RepID=A0A9N8ZMV6_9GLOM|nr:8807_t:CDS:2 [Paraglomus occultum]